MAPSVVTTLALTVGTVATLVLGHPALAPARPGDLIVAVPAMTSAPATLSLPTASPELAARLQEGLDGASTR